MANKYLDDPEWVAAVKRVVRDSQQQEIDYFTQSIADRVAEHRGPPPTDPTDDPRQEKLPLVDDEGEGETQ